VVAELGSVITVRPEGRIVRVGEVEVLGLGVVEGTPGRRLGMGRLQEGLGGDGEEIRGSGGW